MNDLGLPVIRPDATTCPPQVGRGSRGSGSLVCLLLNSLATIHCVWFYLLRVPSGLDRSAYERGLERTPFQCRALLMVPLGWAHDSPFLLHLSSTFSAMNGWLPGHIAPEGLMEAVCDVISIVIAGMVARSLYQSASRNAGRKGILAPFVYPVTLLMINVTYNGMVSHAIRFVYDLPSLGFFSVGIFLLYQRRSLWLFCVCFFVGTINRETTLLLLPLFLLAECHVQSQESSKFGLTRDRETVPLRWRQLFVPRTLIVTMTLALFWMGWHFWINRHFAANRSAAGPRLLLNVGTILCPLAWPQLAGMFAYLLPLVLIGRRKIPDTLLRLWLTVLPLWALFMLFVGLWLETRIFGELIPLVASSSVLIAETYILNQSKAEKSALPLCNPARLVCSD